MSGWSGIAAAVYCSVAWANGEIVSTEFALEYGEPFSHFGYLSRNIEQMFRTGRPVYPVERTGITTGITSAMMGSNAQGGAQIERPCLTIPYRSYEFAQRTRERTRSVRRRSAPTDTRAPARPVKATSQSGTSEGE